VNSLSKNIVEPHLFLGSLAEFPLDAQQILLAQPQNIQGLLFLGLGFVFEFQKGLEEVAEVPLDFVVGVAVSLVGLRVRLAIIWRMVRGALER
jgi:hypothetical protein